MGKQCPRYRARKKTNRRRCKRASRRHGRRCEQRESQTLPAAGVKTTVTNRKSEHRDVQNTTEQLGDGIYADGSKRIQARDDQKKIIELEANNQRLRKLLIMEQQRPHIFLKDCLKCQQRLNDRDSASNMNLRELMFSGNTIGSRNLLAELNISVTK